MKTEQRHALKSNELEKLTAKLRPFFEKHGMQIVLGISAIVVVAAAALFWTRTSATEKEAGWSGFIAANTTAETYLNIAETENLADKPVSAWARLEAAERYLQTGIQQSLENREGDRGLVSDLNEARQNFELVAKAAPPNSKMRERALYGVARCLETMAGVNQRTDAENSMPADLLEEAVKRYEDLISEYPDTVYNRKRYEDEELGKLERRLKFLKSEEAQRFYAWFRTQNPKSQNRFGPLDGFPFDRSSTGTPPVMLPPIPNRLLLPFDETDGGGPLLPEVGSEGPVSAPDAPSETGESREEESSDDSSAAPEKK